MTRVPKNPAQRALDLLKHCGALEIAIVIRKLEVMYHDKAINDVLGSLETEIRAMDEKNPALRVLAQRKRLFDTV